MLSNRLKSLIADTELTQKDVAIRLELSQQRFNAYTSGKREPDYETLGKIADFFSVSTDYLLGRTDISAPFSAPADPSLQQLTENYLTLNADGQAELLKHSILLIQSGLYIKHMDLPARQA